MPQMSSKHPLGSSSVLETGDAVGDPGSLVPLLSELKFVGETGEKQSYMCKYNRYNTEMDVEKRSKRKKDDFYEQETNLIFFPTFYMKIFKHTTKLNFTVNIYTPAT